MNAFHRRYCASPEWAGVVRDSLLPWALDGLDLGDDVLEVGPGFGVTTGVLVERVPRLTVLEVDDGYAERLRADLGDRVAVVSGDGAAMPFPDGRFSSVVCFTMLHHIPSKALQDKLFAEVARVLHPGGRFAGSDSRRSLRFRLVHVFDTMVVVDPATLPGRLSAAGLVDVHIDVSKSMRFRARKPQEER